MAEEQRTVVIETRASGTTDKLAQLMARIQDELQETVRIDDLVLRNAREYLLVREWRKREREKVVQEMTQMLRNECENK